MATSFSATQLERFRREAKKLSRELTITHSEALDRIAGQNGFTNWSLLSKHSSATGATSAAEQVTRSLPMGAYRYYLHGDVSESDPTKCYCARCDVFWPLDHLVPSSYHTDGKDGERFLSNLTSWNKLPPAERGRKFRPDRAPNILEASARAARAAREAARSQFHRWLDAQRNRDDPVGDLAEDILRDEGFPLSASTKREVENYFEGYRSHVIRAVRQAWREFEGEEGRKQTMAEALAAELNLTVVEAEELADAEPTELTGHSGESLSGYEFDFTGYASPKLAAKLMKMRGSLRLTVGPWFLEGIRSSDFPR
jgi:uncharacterized protein YozE (UPF0346 family)